MGMIRVAERHRLAAVRTAIHRYPRLRDFLDPDRPSSWSASSFTRLRDHAVELCRKALMEDLRSFHDHRCYHGVPACQGH